MNLIIFLQKFPVSNTFNKYFYFYFWLLFILYIAFLFTFSNLFIINYSNCIFIVDDTNVISFFLNSPKKKEIVVHMAVSTWVMHVTLFRNVISRLSLIIFYTVVKMRLMYHCYTFNFVVASFLCVRLHISII